MATINYYLDCRSKKKDGTSPLKVVVNTTQGNFLISTGIYLEPAQWDSKTRVITKHPQRLMLNSHLNDLLMQSEQYLIAEKKKLGRALSKAEMKAVLIPLFQDGYEKKSPVVSVFNQFIKDNKKKKRTQEMYATTLKKIESFTGCHASSLQFEDITVGWLQKFESWLMDDCPAANARGIHLRNLRSVFNAAIDDELTTSYPFRKFKITKETTRKRALSAEQIRSMPSLITKPTQQRYVDTFMLMVYLMGINAIDLLTAKPSQIVDGRFEYKRAKTGTLYSIKLEPEALEIINKYRGKKYLLKFCDNISRYNNFMMRMNKCLDQLIKGCTSYYARHSVASIAAELDIPLDTIARMLGHTDPSRRITLVYVDFNQKKVDEANRKVMDYILYNKRD